MENMAVKMTA